MKCAFPGPQRLRTVLFMFSLQAEPINISQRQVGEQSNNERNVKQLIHMQEESGSVRGVGGGNLSRTIASTVHLG